MSNRGIHSSHSRHSRQSNCSTSTRAAAAAGQGTGRCSNRASPRHVSMSKRCRGLSTSALTSDRLRAELTKSSHVDNPTAGPRIHARKPTGIAATPSSSASSETATQHWPDEARPTSSQERRPTMERERRVQVSLRLTITRPPTVVREEASMSAKPEDAALEAQLAVRHSDNASGPPMAPTLASADATATSSRAARGLRNTPASAPRAPRSSGALMASHIPTSSLAHHDVAPA